MRETKFRGKCIETGKWIKGCLFYNIDPTKEERTLVDISIYEGIRNLVGPKRVVPETVGMFIGKTDMKGFDIYEGDILRIHILSNTDHYGETSDFVVEIEETAWGFDVSWTNIYGTGYECSTHILRSPESDNVDVPNYEIIGNIHDK